MPLYHFLQNCLAVIEQLLVFNIRQNEAVDKSFCRLKTAVQIDRTDHGFQRIRKNRLASSSAGQVLPLAQIQILSKVNLPGAQRKRRLTDDARAQLCQIALREICMLLIEELTRHDL